MFWQYNRINGRTSAFHLYILKVLVLNHDRDSDKLDRRLWIFALTPDKMLLWLLPRNHYSFHTLPWPLVAIQSVPGRKVNILGGHSIGHSKQKCLHEHVYCFEWFPRCTTAKLLIWKRYYVYVLFLIPVFIVKVTELVEFLINIRKFHRQHQRTLQLVWRHGVLFVWVRLDVSLCRR